MDVSQERLAEAWRSIEGRERLLREKEAQNHELIKLSGYVAGGLFALCLIIFFLGVNVRLEVAALFSFAIWVGSQYLFRPGHFATDYEDAVKRHAELVRIREALTERGLDPNAKTSDQP